MARGGFIAGGHSWFTRCSATPWGSQALLGSCQTAFPIEKGVWCISSASSLAGLTLKLDGLVIRISALPHLSGVLFIVSCAAILAPFTRRVLGLRSTMITASWSFVFSLLGCAWKSAHWLTGK